MRKDFERVYLKAHGNVAVLTLNHPEVMNAASANMVQGLREALAHIESAGDFRCVVLTGEGRGFCSGANLSDTSQRQQSGAFDAGSVLETGFHPLLRTIRNFRMPFITAVNGAAAGVGMSIALMGDLVLAARSAYFLQAFTRIGLIPDGGSTWLLPRLIGLARARELSMLAEKLPAEKALEWGLINRVFDDAQLMSAAIAMAQKLADGPTVALAAARQLYWASSHHSFEQQLDLERQTQKAQGVTEDFVEGVTAFLEKRPARFKGK